jgi:hypothetical protein
MPLTYWKDGDWKGQEHLFTILEATDEAAEKYGFAYGSDLSILTDEHIQALKDGKMLAFSDGEYHHFLIYSQNGKHPNGH